MAIIVPARTVLSVMMDGAFFDTIGSYYVGGSTWVFRNVGTRRACSAAFFRGGNVYLLVRDYCLNIPNSPVLMLSPSDADDAASVFLGFLRGFISDILRRCKLSFRDGGNLRPRVTLYGRSLQIMGNMPGSWVVGGRWLTEYNSLGEVPGFPYG